MKQVLTGATAAVIGAAAMAWAQIPTGGPGCDPRTIAELRDIRAQAIKMTERLFWLVPDPEEELRRIRREDEERRKSP